MKLSELKPGKLYQVDFLEHRGQVEMFLSYEINTVVGYVLFYFLSGMTERKYGFILPEKNPESVDITNFTEIE